MSKVNELAAAFVQQRQISQVPVMPINAFSALFAVQDLDEYCQRTVEKILVDGYEPGMFPEEEVNGDIAEVKQITKELKAIKKQELILVGERIAAAREIFKKYNEKSFREWLELTFGSFKTGYNYFAFFDLYKRLPEELQEPFKEMPAKAAYILASKKAPLEKKVEIVKGHSKEPVSQLILLINELGKKKKKKPVVDKILDSLERGAQLLQEEVVDSAQKERLRCLIEQLQHLFV